VAVSHPWRPSTGRHLPRPLRTRRSVCARGGPWLMPGVVLSEAGGFPHISPTLGPSYRGTTGGVSPPASRPSWGKPPGLDCHHLAGGARRPPHRGSAPRRVASARRGSRQGFIKGSPVTGDPGGLPSRATTVVGTTGGPRLRRGSGLSAFPLLGGVSLGGEVIFLTLGPRSTGSYGVRDGGLGGRHGG